MHFHLTKKIAGPKHKKDGRINPHRFWVFFVTAFIFVLIVEIVWFTYFFIASSERLDAPVVPELNTNSGQIGKIESSLKNIEDAVSSRTGN